MIEFRAERGCALRDDRRGLAGLRRTARPGRGARSARELGIDVVWDCELAQTPGGLLPGAGRHPVRDRQVARGRAVRRPAVDGDQDRRPGDAQEFAEAIHAVYPDKMLAYNLSPSFNWDTTGMSDDEMRELPGGAREAGLRLQLHHLRRPPDRRPRGRGVRHRPPRGRHARARPAAAEAPPARVALPHAADPGRRAAGRRGAHGRLRPHRHDQGHGQGLDPAPAPGPDRGADQAAGGLAGDCGPSTTASRARCAVACARTPPARSCWS